MKLTDLGTSHDIGANCLYVELGPFRFVIDAGVDSGSVGYEAVPDFSKIDDYSLDFVILTHCHLDHLGSLPILLKKQPQVQVITSQPSASLAPRMLQNSFNVMKKIRDEQQVLEYPLFTLLDIDKLKEQIVPTPYGEAREHTKEGQSLFLTLHPSGHIPGACGLEVVYKRRKIFFTGDVLFTNQITVPGAQFPEGPFDTLIMETTRGGTQRKAGRSRDEEMDRLIETINHTVNRGGSCLIPIFALGRMQELLSLLHEARLEKKLVDCPIFSAGLGLDLVNYLDTISKKTKLIHFRSKILKHLKVRKLSRELRPGEDLGEKGIYLVSSGMMVESTPSYVVAASLLDFHHNSICFVGYCDPDTPGGQLLSKHQGDDFVFQKLDYVAHVRAYIERFDLSGHADRDELVAYAEKVSPRSIVLTHGDPEARLWFDQELAQIIPNTKVIDPDQGTSYLV